MEPTVFITTSLLFITVGIVLVYCRKIKEVSERYIEAKSVVSDIILSFRRDLQVQEQKTRSVSQRIEDLTLRGEGRKKIEQLTAEVMRIKTDLEEVCGTGRTLSDRVEKLGNSVDELFLRQEENLRKVSELAEARRAEPPVLGRIEGVIPIEREKALARLTDTELRVLDVLAHQGDKTASHLKNWIGLTREHTARLMKSLYMRGYVERTAEKLPYVYHIKDEMKSVLTGETKKKSSAPA